MINRISTGALLVGSEANLKLEKHSRHQSVTQVRVLAPGILVCTGRPGAPGHIQRAACLSASERRPCEPLLPVTLQVQLEVATEGRLDASALPASGAPGADSELAVK
jgi:hypothetical protein